MMITLTTAVKCRSLSASALGMTSGLSDRSRKRSRTSPPKTSLLTWLSRLPRKSSRVRLEFLNEKDEDEENVEWET